MLQRNKILSFAKGLNIPVIDITEEFGSQHDPLSLFQFRLSGHYNSKGYNLVAKQIEKHITD